MLTDFEFVDDGATVKDIRTQREDVRRKTRKCDSNIDHHGALPWRRAGRPDSCSSTDDESSEYCRNGCCSPDIFFEDMVDSWFPAGLRG